jgi:V/A-type H+-transporting ATPase subunit A
VRLAAILAESDRLSALAELMGASSLPDRERVALLGGRLIREGVLQQSAVDVNDAYCTPAKGAALADSALEVIAVCLELADAGAVAASALEAFDFSLLLRAARDVPPTDVDEIYRRRATVIEQLRAMR